MTKWRPRRRPHPFRHHDDEPHPPDIPSFSVVRNSHFLWYNLGMETENAPRRPGRPATGVTPKRNIRMGATWDTAEELALALARRSGTVRQVHNRHTGATEEAGDITAYVEEALRRENLRITRQLNQTPPTRQEPE